jgi:hypothetical protein
MTAVARTAGSAVRAGSHRARVMGADRPGAGARPETRHIQSVQSQVPLLCSAQARYGRLE